jgi:hypothetical protein
VDGGPHALEAMIQPLQTEAESTMKTYVAHNGRKAVLAFRAVDDDQALAMINDQKAACDLI